MQKRTGGKIRIFVVSILCFTMLGLSACTEVPFLNDVWNGIVELTEKFIPTGGKEDPITPPNNNNTVTPPEGDENESSTPEGGENEPTPDDNQGDDSNISNEFTVTFVTNCSSVIEAQTITSGGKVAKPTDPVKISANTDYKFEGWYNGDKLWDFENDVVEEDITLVAKWTVESIYSDDYIIF